MAEQEDTTDRPTLSLKEPSKRFIQPPGHPNEEIYDRVMEQVEHGLDVDRLLPSREKRERDLLKKIDKPLPENGWRMFVAGQAHAMIHGKAPKKRSAEVMLVETIKRWQSMVTDLAPDRMDRLNEIVQAGFENPAPPVLKGGE